jgi:acyl carrier protein
VIVYKEVWIMNAEILGKVKEIVASQLGKEQSEITDTASFIDDLGADSLDTMELVLALEDEFGIKIEDEDAEKIKTVKDAVEYIEKNK